MFVWNLDYKALAAQDGRAVSAILRPKGHHDEIKNWLIRLISIRHDNKFRFRLIMTWLYSI